MSKTTDHLGRPIVVVTGIGVITSLGVGKKDNWDALTAGRSGIHTISRFPTDDLRTRICGTVDFLRSSGRGSSALTYEMAETTAIEANRFAARVLADCDVWVRAIGAPVDVRVGSAAATGEMDLEAALARAVATVEPRNAPARPGSPATERETMAGGPDPGAAASDRGPVGPKVAKKARAPLT